MVLRVIKRLLLAFAVYPIPVIAISNVVPSVVQGDLRRIPQHLKPINRPSQLQRRQQPIVTSLGALGSDFIGYTLNFSVGTPPQEVSVHVDTASSETWFNSLDSYACQHETSQCSLHSYYTLSKSSTAHKAPLPLLNISYGDGISDAQIQYYTDNVSGDGFNMNNYTFGIAENSTNSLGVLGLAPSSDRSPALLSQTANPPNTFLDALKNSGAIQTTAFSLYAKDQDTGTIVFGGVDSAKHNGPLAIAPMVSHGGITVFYSVNVSSLSLDDGKGKILGSLTASSEWTHILDSGSTITSLVSGIAGPLFQHLGVKSDVINSEGYPFIDCSWQKKNQSLTWHLGSGVDFNISIPLSELIHIDGEKCLLDVLESDEYYNDSILGQNVLKHLYTVFDQENNRIGLAPLAATATESNVQAILPGQPIPGSKPQTNLPRGMSKRSLLSRFVRRICWSTQNLNA